MREMVTLALYLVALKVLDFVDNLKNDESEDQNK